MSETIEPKDRLLIMEPDEHAGNILLDFLNPRYECERVVSTGDAFRLLSRDSFSVIISNYNLATAAGFDFISTVKSLSPHTAIILICEDISANETIAAFRAGATDFLQTPFNLEEVETAVNKGFSEHERKRLYDYFQNSVEDLTAIETAKIEKNIDEIENSYRVTLKAVAQALETRDFETYGHSERVVTFSLRLAHEVGIKKDLMRDLELGALLHDVGKIGVPDSILRKPAKLNEKEWDKMKLHPIHGFKILRDIPFLEGAVKIVSQHHERWDGTGYPLGLRGENIDICARIFSVVDAFDTMISDTVYRKGRPYQDALKELDRCAGTQFDPAIVEAFKEISVADWDFLRKRSLKKKQEVVSFQDVVAELITSQENFEMVH
ncbi:MAG: HD domain-containing protein [Pyrinomonadaceae bacterium]|nr:HD domain-containing protein [Pyrinomonadaceae bacterium]